MNNKISTKLGLSVVVIFAIVTFFFLWKINNINKVLYQKLAEELNLEEIMRQKDRQLKKGIVGMDDCAENIKDEAGYGNYKKLEFYNGFAVNGNIYSAWEMKNIQDSIAKNRFNIVNGCLYDGEKRMLEKTMLYQYHNTNLFINNPREKNMGESIDEWFRFKNNDKIFIYLRGKSRCNGCLFNGLYIVINKETGSVKGKINNLLTDSEMILSPNNKLAIEISYPKGENYKKDNIDIWIHDFIHNKKRRLLKIPKSKTILAMEDKSSLVDKAIVWTSKRTVEIQLFEKDEKSGFAKKESFQKVDYTYSNYIKSGNPIVFSFDK